MITIQQRQPALAAGPGVGATNVELIGVAMGFGGPDEGAARAPVSLRASGLAERLRDAGSAARWSRDLLPRVMPDGSRVGSMHDLNARLAQRVAASLAAGRFPLVIGGDHSIAAGTWAGAARHLRPAGSLGLLWIDAHMDAHTLSTTASGNPHGMPLAELLGAGSARASIAPEHVALVGVRSYEPEEAALLARLGVRVFFQDEVERRGLEAVLNEALARVTRASAFGVTLDIDALDPRDAPATSTRVECGLRADALLSGLGQVVTHAGLIAAEIVEYNPLLDGTGTTAALVHALAVSLTTPVRLERRAAA